MASPRQTGLYGSLYLHASIAGGQPALASVTKVADVFNLAFESQVEVAECTRKGESYRRYVPGPGGARITGEARFQKLAVLAAIADDPLVEDPGALAHPRRVAFKIVTNDNDQAAGFNLATTATGLAGEQIIKGFGYFASANVNIPFDDAITQPFEIQVDGEWEFEATT